MTNPIRTYQLWIAPTSAIVKTHDDPRYEGMILDVDGKDPSKIITVQALSKDTIEVPEGYTVLGTLEVTPQDFEVGDTIYMAWFCLEWSCREELLINDHLAVTSITEWDRTVDNIGWHEPQPLPGTRKYLVTLPTGLKISSLGGSVTWNKNATATVVKVIN